MSGYKTILYDVDAAMVQKGRSSIEKNLRSLTGKNKHSAAEEQAATNHLSFTADIKDCIADLIIEAIVEKPEIKLDLFEKIASVNSNETIIASNTSSLSLTALAEKIAHPERFAGMHFFNPAPLMKLVEIIKTPLTSKSITDTLIETAKNMGKTPVLCKDAPGFVVNHVARPYYLEALRMIQTGMTDIETIDEVMEATGFRMGPFRLMDLIGNDINYAVSCSVYEAMGQPERLKPSPIQQQKVNAGELGRKTGKGYYQYEQ